MRTRSPSPLATVAVFGLLNTSPACEGASASAAATDDGGSESTTDADTSTGGDAVCGDGVVGADEECDDGNQLVGDDCTADCLFEPGAVISGKVFPGRNIRDLAATAGGFVLAGYETSNEWDTWLAAVDLEGRELWSRTRSYGAFLDYWDDLDLDENGNIVVAGTVHGDGSRSMLVSKYSSDGTELWSRTLSPGMVSYEEALAVDASGSIYLGGNMYSMVDWYDGIILKLDSTGELQWELMIEEAPGTTVDSVTLASDGNPIVSVSGPDQPMTLRKYSASDGALIFEAAVDDAGGSFMDSLLRSEDDTLLAGLTGPPIQSGVARRTATGEPIWAVSFAVQGRVRGLAEGRDGRIYATIDSQVTGDQPGIVNFAIVEPTGEIISKRALFGYRGLDVTIGADGFVYAATYDNDLGGTLQKLVP